MGADLYINSLYKPARERWEPEFEKAVAERDRLKSDTPEYEEAQRRVIECFDVMYAQGYFRDPYNCFDVLWKLKLSWWDDVLPNVDKDGFLSVDSVQELLEAVNSRQGIFEENLASLSEKERADFRGRCEALRSFLQQAIELDEPVRASL